MSKRERRFKEKPRRPVSSLLTGLIVRTCVVTCQLA